MKKIFAVLLVLALAAILLPASAESYTPAAQKADAVPEDFIGDWVCKYADNRGTIVDAESHLEELGMYKPMTVSIGDTLAEFSGIQEMESGAMPISFAGGTMVFEPEPGVTVFTLTPLEDGAIMMKFNMIEGAWPLYLFKVEAEEPAALR